jgi:outer membrane protein OmpA-like peptidoglycan-associated protein
VRELSALHIAVVTQSDQFCRSLFKAVAHLRRLAAVLNQNPDTRVRVDGHTNENASQWGRIKGKAFCMQLSTGRAEALMQRLVSLGIDAARMTCKGFAGDFPHPSGEALKNVRCEFTVL